MSTPDHIDQHERRARQALRAAVVGRSGSHDAAADELLDDMLGGRIAVGAVVSGLVRVINHLVTLIENDETGEFDLDTVIGEVLDR